MLLHTTLGPIWKRLAVREDRISLRALIILGTVAVPWQSRSSCFQHLSSASVAVPLLASTAYLRGFSWVEVRTAVFEGELAGQCRTGPSLGSPASDMPRTRTRRPTEVAYPWHRWTVFVCGNWSARWERGVAQRYTDWDDVGIEGCQKGAWTGRWEWPAARETLWTRDGFARGPRDS